MVAMVDHGIDRYGRLGGERDVPPVDHLRDEQKLAVHQVLDSRDFAINLRGAAGTGKTATLQEIGRGLRESGREVTAVAPTRSPVEELQEVGFQDATTVSRLLEDETAQAALRGQVLIVDEAGMISGLQMEGILRLAGREQARILFSGDTRQIQSVEASDALRVLERESQMKTSPSPASSAKRTCNTETPFKRCVNPRSRDLKSWSGWGRAQGSVRRTRPCRRRSLSRHDVTRAIRIDLSARGHLGQSVTMDRYIPMQWTEAQKRDLSNYREGQILLAHRAARGMEKHEALTVSSVGPDAIVSRNARGEEKAFTPSQTRSFSVHEQRSIEVAPGDRLLLTGNRWDADFRATNG
jgi:ATP-dependent exoDNAse (exonuclease V) alpha subunit